MDYDHLLIRPLWVPYTVCCPLYILVNQLNAPRERIVFGLFVTLMKQVSENMWQICRCVSVVRSEIIESYGRRFVTPTLYRSFTFGLEIWISRNKNRELHFKLMALRSVIMNNGFFCGLRWSKLLDRMKRVFSSRIRSRQYKSIESFPRILEVGRTKATGTHHVHHYGKNHETKTSQDKKPRMFLSQFASQMLWDILSRDTVHPSISNVQFPIRRFRLFCEAL